jgi:hypothetical protein
VRPYKAFSRFHNIMHCNPVTLCRNLRTSPLSSSFSIRSVSAHPKATRSGAGSLVYLYGYRHVETHLQSDIQHLFRKGLGFIA